jgi:[ribosomal protein S5]-alanine N-acetyltransferase
MNKKIMLKTSRLVIYTPNLNDFSDLHLLQSNSEVMTFIGSGVRSREEVLLGLRKAINHQKNHGFSLGSVFEKNTHQFIGRAGLIYKDYNDKQPEVEVAYALLPEYWRQGYATELALNLIKWAHTALQITHLIGMVNPENFNSKKVLKKAGMNLSRIEEYSNKKVEIWSYSLGEQ